MALPTVHKQYLFLVNGYPKPLLCTLLGHRWRGSLLGHRWQGSSEMDRSVDDAQTAIVHHHCTRRRCQHVQYEFINYPVMDNKQKLEACAFLRKIFGDVSWALDELYDGLYKEPKSENY